jgi:PadR family transcriptional regulator
VLRFVLVKAIQILRITKPLLDLLEAMLNRDGQEVHGYEMRQATGLGGATVHKILERLHTNGWMDRRWEEAGDRPGRPPRRYYRLNTDGAEAARQLLRKRRPGSAALPGPPCVTIMEGVHERHYDDDVISVHRAADCSSATGDGPADPEQASGR